MSHITATLERCTEVICIFQVSVCGRVREYMYLLIYSLKLHLPRRHLPALSTQVTFAKANVSAVSVGPVACSRGVNTLFALRNREQIPRYGNEP